MWPESVIPTHELGLYGRFLRASLGDLSQQHSTERSNLERENGELRSTLALQEAACLRLASEVHPLLSSSYSSSLLSYRS